MRQKLNMLKGQFSILLLLILIVGANFIFSCKKRVSQETEVSISADSIVTKLSILRDSIDRAWVIMINDDNEKLQYLKRLLDEVSYNNYNMNRYKELSAMVDDLKGMRYDRETMRNSALIDQYDSATSEVTRQVIEFSMNYPGYETNELMKELIEDINFKNGYVLLHRVHYDIFAEEYNELLDDYSNIPDNEVVRSEKFPLFKLPPDNI
mgnify:CR=1 FL=1